MGSMGALGVHVVENFGEGFSQARKLVLTVTPLCNNEFFDPLISTA
jgi:hypothetical protein